MIFRYNRLMKAKANVFSIFSFIVIISTLILLILLYARYDDEKSHMLQQQKLDATLIARTSHIQLLHYESILELLGKQLLDNNNYKNVKKSKKILNSLLQLNSEILGFGLIDVNGTFLALSGNLDVKKMPNIKTKKETRISFEKALYSNIMIIGRTYYLKPAKSWVVPIRKTLRNGEGKAIAVMTAGLKIHQGNSFLESLQFSQYKNSTTSIIKDFDKEHKLYRLYYDHSDKISREKIYSKPLPKKIYVSMIDSLKTMQTQTQPLSKAYSSTTKNEWGETVLAGIMYDKRYEIFVINENKISFLYNKIFSSIKMYLLIYILSLVIFYIFLKYVEKLDKAQKNRLTFQATHDSLTKLPNRQYMYEHLKSFQKGRDSFELLYIDLDNFKNINDNFGHNIGDEILKGVAHRLEKWIDYNSMLVRQGGDEFIIIKELEQNNSTAYYENIIKDIGSVYSVDNMEFTLGASIGISRFPVDAQDITTLLSLSDMAMYEAKKQKNSFCIYANKFRSLQRRKVEIDQELYSALKKDEFYMVYQPQINSDGTLYGVEALVRWDNQKLGSVGPDEFISIAEESNIIVELSHFITKKSAQDIYELQRDLGLTFHLAINLSIKQLFSQNFIQTLLEDLKLFENSYELITLEITERLFIEDTKHVLPILNLLSEKGFELSLDDFGTGYSSLSILRTLPINEIKIDKSFIDDMLTDKDACILSESIIQMGQNLSMKTLAEGVELKAQVNLLKSQKCDIFQGYYYSKPLRKDDLKNFILNQTS